MKEIKLNKQYTMTVTCLVTDELDINKVSTLYEHLSELIKSGETCDMDKKTVQYILNILSGRVTATKNDDGYIRLLSQGGDYLIELTPAEEW